MEEIILDAQVRSETGRAKANNLRIQGLIPAVVYGEGKAAVPITISHHKLIQLIHQHRIENAIISLKIGDDKKAKPRSCLIKETQYDPMTGDIIHVDFNEISLTKVIRVNCPVAAKGEPVGVKQEGGSLEHILWEIEVECLPTDIPKEIAIDVSNLKMGDSVHVKDIVFPSNVKVITPLEAIVLTIAAPMKEEVPVEAVEGAEPQEPEVIKEKKEVPEEGAKEEEGKEKEKEKK